MASSTSLRSFLRDRRRTIADVLLALAACWAASSIYFSHEDVLLHYGAVLPLSSDNVAPYLLFDDLFRRHLPISGWMFPEAPFFVPDIVLGWIVYALTGSLVGAVELYALISSLTFVLLIRSVLLRAGWGTNAWLIWLALWVLGCAIGVAATPSWLSHFYGYIFVPYIHSGMLLGVVAGLALLFRDGAGAGWRSLAALATLIALMLVSDRLFALQYALPAIFVCVWVGRTRRSAWHTRAALLVATILIASECLRWLYGNPFATESNDRTPIGVSFDAIVANMASLATRDPVNTLLIAAGFVATVWALRRPRNGGDVSQRRLLAAFALLSALLPIVVSLALGRYHSFEELRYFQSMQLLVLPLAGLLASSIERIANRRAYVSSAVAAAIAIVLSPLFAGSSRAALRGYLVDQEICLRDAIAREHLTLGAATYWRANEMTARLSDGPVIVPLSTDVAPRMRNIVDLGWLDPLDVDALPTAIDFVDEYGYAPEALDRAFGPASRRVVCPRSAYRIYRREDGALAHLYRHADWLPSQLLQRVGVANVPAAAWAAEDRFVTGDAIRASGTFAQPMPVLATAFDIPKGAIEVELAYRYRALTADASVAWHVAIVDEAGVPTTELGSGVLDPSADLRRFALPLGAREAAGEVLGISLIVQGGVDLEVTRVRVAVR